MVIEPEVGNKFEEMVRLHRAVGDVGTGVDVLVYSDHEASICSQVQGTVLYWAYKEGRVMYDSRH